MKNYKGIKWIAQKIIKAVKSGRTDIGCFIDEVYEYSADMDMNLEDVFEIVAKEVYKNMLNVNLACVPYNDTSGMLHYQFILVKDGEVVPIN